MAMFMTDDGRELTVPVLLNGSESVMEFIDLPYSGVSLTNYDGEDSLNRKFRFVLHSRHRKFDSS
jgi:hypothetical protein